MNKYRIRWSEVPYGQKVVFKDTTVEAHTFKVNDQGTAIFIDKYGSPVASFKHWTTIKPVGPRVSAARAGIVS